MAPKSSVIVLTQGGRERDLDALVESLHITDHTEAILVGNGSAVMSAPPGWRSVHSPTNLGVPGGRNFGASEALGEYLIFIDDDAVSLRPDLVTEAERRFDTEPDLAVIGFRIVKQGSNESQSRWSPHIGHGDLTRSTDVTTFVGGGHAIRKSVFDELGGYFSPLFYGLEETDFAWRVLDAGWRVSFDSELMLEHPDVSQDRHPAVLRRTARNRIWLARRHLPVPLLVVYSSVWLTIQLARARSIAQVSDIFAGTWQGISQSPGEQQKIQWATAARMTRLGRPPVI